MTSEPATHTAKEIGPLGLEKSPERSWRHRLVAALMLPREHGAWVMLLVAYLLGTVTAGSAGWPSALLLVAILALFIASRPLELSIQGRGSSAVGRLVAYGVIGIAAGLGLLVRFGLWMLLPLGAGAGLILGLQVPLRKRHLDRTWPARLASIAALLAAGPAAYYVASGSLDTRALGVWLLASLYSGSSVFYVRLHYRPPAKRKGEPLQEGRLAAERQMGTYLATIFATTAVLGLAGALPPLAMAAFVPLAIKVAWAWRRRDLRPSLRQIGLREMGHSALFLLLAGGAMRAWG